MSAFVGKTDIGWTYGNVRFRVRADIAIQTRCVCFLPKADIAPVFSNFPNVVCVDEPSETHHACVQCGGSDAHQFMLIAAIGADALYHARHRARLGKAAAHFLLHHGDIFRQRLERLLGHDLHDLKPFFLRSCKMPAIASEVGCWKSCIRMMPLPCWVSRSMAAL